MADGSVEISDQGRMVRVPSVQIAGQTVIISGGWLKVASVWDEDWQEVEAVNDPEEYIKTLMKQRPRPDIFTFSQRLPDTEPKFKYPFEWDNVAAIPTASYNDWWERLPKVTRKNVRRGQKHGITTEVVGFDDELVNGIIGIHQDTPMRQGKPFAHYGKDFSVVKREYGTFRDRSDFLGAFLQGELIGIVKLVYVGNIACTMNVIAMTRHYALKPTNILIAKAVEVCEQNKMSYLVYGKYIYGNKTDSSLTEFKRLNGFEKIELPQYYIPLTLKGRVAMKLKLHLGLLGILPGGVISVLRSLRTRYNLLKMTLLNPARKLDSLRHEKEDAMAENGRVDACLGHTGKGELDCAGNSRDNR